MTTDLRPPEAPEPATVPPPAPAVPPGLVRAVAGARRVAGHRRTRAAAPWLVLVVAAAVAGVVYTLQSRRLWFFQDDWDFLLTRGAVPGADLGLLAPHGDHWSTGPILVYRALFGVFGLDSYLPWAVVTVLVHLVVGTLVAVLLRRLGAGPWTAALAGVALLFLGAGSEVWLVDNAMNHTGSLAFALGAAVVALGPSTQVRTAGVWALLVASLMCSGTGVTGTVFVVVLVLLRHGLRRALVVLSAPVLVFVFWYVEHGRTGASGVLDPLSLYLQVPGFVWAGLTNALDRIVPARGLGAVLLVAVLVAPVLARNAPAALRQASVAGVVAAVAQLTFVGASRIGFGPQIAEASRYVYISVVLLAPALGLLLHLLVQRVGPGARRLAGGLVALVVVALVVDGVSQSLAFARGQESVTGPWRDRMLGIVAATDAGEQVLTTESEDWLNAELDPRLVVDPAIRDSLPDEPASALARLDAEALYMTGVRGTVYGVGRPERVVPVAGFSQELRPREGATGCRGFRAVVDGAVLELTSADGAEVGLTGPAGQVRTRLVRDATESSVERTWTVGTSSYVATSARDAVLRVTLGPAGDYVVCQS